MRFPTFLLFENAGLEKEVLLKGEVRKLSTLVYLLKTNPKYKHTVDKNISMY